MGGTTGLEARSARTRVRGRVMPFWYSGAVVLGVASAVVVGDGIATPVVGGTALLVVAVVHSVTLLVPVNDRMRTWSEGGAPTDWRDQVRRWDRLHHGRTVLILAAFVLVTSGLIGG